MNTWEMIALERAALADSLAGLAASSWTRPSLLPGWTVRDVVGHLISEASLTPVSFLTGLAATGFRFNVMNDKGIRTTTAGRTDDELVELYRSRIGARTKPPGPTVQVLAETIVHGEDICRALDGYREHPIEHVLAVANFLKGSNLLIGAKSRISGVRLRATDTDWQHGTGPELAGPALILVMAMTGRRVALDDLTGAGVPVLRARS
jgi:uncharacterized protein (TIGR03083 family)